MVYIARVHVWTRTGQGHKYPGSVAVPGRTDTGPTATTVTGSRVLPADSMVPLMDVARPTTGPSSATRVNSAMPGYA